VNRQAVDLVLEPKLLFFQLVEQDIVRVRALLFPVDLGLKSSMLGLECLDVSLFHLCQILSIDVTTS
jgi:hypothetical protein